MPNVIAYNGLDSKSKCLKDFVLVFVLALFIRGRVVGVIVNYCSRRTTMAASFILASVARCGFVAMVTSGVDSCH